LGFKRDEVEGSRTEEGEREIGDGRNNMLKHLNLYASLLKPIAY
jgi:hypothetical protein